MFSRLIILKHAVILLLGFTFLFGEPYKQDDRQLYGGAVALHGYNIPGVLDPANINSLVEQTVASLLFPRLIEIDNNGKHIPSILESWEFSEDRRSLTLKLRPETGNNVEMPASIQVLVNSFKHLIRKAPNSAAGRLLMDLIGAEDFVSGKADRITGLSISDSRTLIMNFKQSQPLILDVLSDIHCAPSRHAELPEMLAIGMGAFIKNGPKAVTANLSFFKGRPFLDYIFFGQDRKSDSNWKRNVVIDFDRSNIVQQFSARTSVKSNPVVYPGRLCVYLVFNKTGSVMADLKKRRRIISAIDADAMVRIFFAGQAERLKHLAPEEAVPAILFKSLVDSPGATENPKGFRSSLKLSYPGDQPSLKLAAERIRVDLMVAGIGTELIPYDELTIPPCDMFIFEGLVSNTRPAYNIWNHLVTLAKITGDESWLKHPQDDELHWLVEMDSDLKSNAILIPLFSTQYSIGVDPRLHGLRFRLDGTIDFESAWIASTEAGN